MDPQAFANVAEEIVKGGTPAHCRTAIGRAYYSSFTTATLLLEADIRFPKRADKHTKVRHYLLNSGHNLLREVARNLGDLKDHRTKADYDMSASDDVDKPVSALFQISVAKKSNETLRVVLNGPERTKVVQAILAYMKLIGDRV